MKCQDIAEQLPLLLYDELETDEAATIRAHLETCDSCAQQWRELEKTRQLLNEWTPAEAGADVAALQDDTPLVMTSPSQSRGPSRLAITSLAAAILLMITLWFVGVDVQKTEGRLTFSFGRGVSPTPMQVIPTHLLDFDPQVLESRIQLATYQQIDQRNFELVEQIDRFFNRWDESHVQQRDEMLNILAQAFQQDMTRLEQGITAVAQNNQRAIRQLEGLTLAVSRGELTPIQIIDPN